jgi:undecaprenyl-diphosphatase
VVAVRVVPALRGRWPIIVAAIVLTVLIGASRAYLRVHWASDVLGGFGAAAMSFAVVAIAALVVAFVRQTDPEPQPEPADRAT